MDKFMDKFKLYMEVFGGKFRRCFFMALPESEQDYEKSRKYYIACDTANQTIAQLAGGTFLMTLLSAAGVSDGSIGTIISMGTLATLFQILTMNFVQHLKKCKLFASVTVSLKIWFGLMFLVPFLSMSDHVKATIIVCFYFTAQIGMQIGNPAIIDWIANLVPDNMRGRYFAKKDSIAVFIVVFSTFIMGIIFDVFKKTEVKTAFTINAAVIILLTFVNLLSLIYMKEPRISLINESGKELHGTLAKREEKKYPKVKSNPIKDIIHVLMQKSFRTILYLNLLWQASFYISSPFNASYQIKELGLSYTYIYTISFAVTILRVYITPKMGKWADKKGNENVLGLTLGFMMVSYLLWSVSIPSNGKILFIISSLFGACGWSFIGIGLLNIQLEFLDLKTRTLQYTILSACSGIFGFIISIFAGKLVNYLQKIQPVLFGKKIYAQQITNFTGAVLLGLTILYLFLVVKKKRKEE